MKRLEKIGRNLVLVGVALLAWLTLPGATATASPASVGEEASAPAISGMAQGSMPMTSGCSPCVFCSMAPAPVTRGFNGEYHGPSAPSWRVHALREPRPAGSFQKRGLRACLPVRIAYCRWLD